MTLAHTFTKAAPRRTNLMFLVALLCLTLGQLLFGTTARPGGIPAFVPGLGLYLVGGLLAWRTVTPPRAEEGRELATWQPPRRTQLICALGLLVLAALPRILWLDTLPYKIDGDAAGFARAAADFLNPNHPPLIGTGWQSHTNVYFFLYSRMLEIFGRTVVGIRSFSALGGILGVLATFALGRALWSFRVGLLAGLVLAVLPFHLVFSRTGTEVVHLTWQLPTATLAIFEGWRRRQWGWLVVGGMIAGLSQYFYPGARLIPLLCVGQIALLVLFADDGIGRIRRGLLALGCVVLGFGLVYGPMIPHFIQHPGIYSARLQLVSITESGWLAEQLAQRPWWQVFGQQLRNAYLPFHAPTDGGRLWYFWPQYLSPFDAALLSLGLLSMWLSRRTPRWLKLYFAGYLLGGIVLAGVITIDTPMPSRYVIFIPAVALLIGYALDQVLVRLLALNGPRLRRATLGLLVGLLCLYSTLNLRNYVRHDTEAIQGTDLTSQTATYAARFLQALPDQQYEILYLQLPLLYYQASPVLPFLLEKSATNIEERPFDCALLDQRRPAGRTMILGPRERIEELRALHQRVTGANLHVFSNPAGDEMISILDLPPRIDAQPSCVDR